MGEKRQQGLQLGREIAAASSAMAQTSKPVSHCKLQKALSSRSCLVWWEGEVSWCEVVVLMEQYLS